MTTDLFNSLSRESQEKIQKKKQPGWSSPMLATLTDSPFSDPQWIYERKFDGERALVFKQGDSVRIMSRNKKELNATYPELVDAVATQKGDFIADGEIVAFSQGVTSFSRLQERMQIKDEEEAWKSNVAVYYYLFDILHIRGRDLTSLPLRERKKILKRGLKFQDKLRLTAYRKEEGETYHEKACQKGWEGIIAKDFESTYAHSRSSKWLKFKCVNVQEMVIGGYTDPEGERIGFGAILIGFYEGDDLVYAGKVGTGFDEKKLKELHARFTKLERKTPPFDRGELPQKDVHWLRPDLVGQIAFTEWTEDNKLRHPRFKGLRRDKEPKDVVRERPA